MPDSRTMAFSLDSCLMTLFCLDGLEGLRLMTPPLIALCCLQGLVAPI